MGSMPRKKREPLTPAEKERVRRIAYHSKLGHVVSDSDFRLITALYDRDPVGYREASRIGHETAVVDFKRSIP